MTGRPDLHRLLGRALGAAGSVGTSARVLGASGILRTIPPTALARMGKALKDWGTGPAGGFTAMAMRYPAVIKAALVVVFLISLVALGGRAGQAG